jgi:hypothetical protein
MFFLKQYEYKNGNVQIKAKESDVFIVVGGC